jgi:hypothetical protein
MTAYNALLLKTGSCLDLKIIDGDLVHHFSIIGQNVNYEVTRDRGELIAIASAYLDDLQQDYRVARLVVRTAAYLFEVLPDGNFYRAYKKLLKNR